MALKSTHATAKTSINNGNFCTWDVVCHTWDQLQVQGANTCSWAEAHLQQEFMAVAPFACTHVNSREKWMKTTVGHERIKLQVQKKG